MLITDGASRGVLTSASADINAAADVVLAFGVQQANLYELQQIADHKEGHYHLYSDYSSLPDQIISIQAAICGKIKTVYG